MSDHGYRGASSSAVPTLCHVCGLEKGRWEPRKGCPRGLNDPPFPNDVIECYRLGYARLESELRGARREWDEQISSANAALAEADRALSAERTARRVMREALEGALRWMEILIDANVATGHFLPHGFVRDHACAECVGAENIPAMSAGFRCGLHRARAALAAEPGEGAAAGGVEALVRRAQEFVQHCLRVGFHPNRAAEFLADFAALGLPPEGHPRAAEVKNG